MYADSFGISLEQRAVIRLFALREPKTRATHTELESVFGSEALALPTVKQWRQRSHQWRTDLFDNSMSERPMTNDLAGAIGSLLEESPFN
jgi:hypothetical protein